MNILSSGISSDTNGIDSINDDQVIPIDKTISALLTPLEFLETLFPSHIKEDIFRILATNHYDLYQTLDDLIDDDEDYEYDYDENGNVVDRVPSNSSITTPNNNVSTTEICKYYIAGVCSNNNCPFLHETHDGKAPQIAPICKFYLNEGCFITNCPYRHSSETVLCKYWIMGTCSKGNDCIYSHQISNTVELFDQNKKSQPINPTTTQLSNKSQPFIPKPQQQQSIPTQDDFFPTLGGRNNNSNVKPNQKGKQSQPVIVKPVVPPPKAVPDNNNFTFKINSKKPTSTKPTVTTPPHPTKTNIKPNIVPSKTIATTTDNKESFPTLSSAKNIPKKKKQPISPSNHSSTSSVSGGMNDNLLDMSSIVKIKHLEELFKHVPLDEIKREFSLTKDVTITTNSLTEKYGPPRIKATTTIRPPQYLGSGGRLTTPTPKGNISWVGTGLELNNLYSKHRDEAIQHGRDRNLCFNLAAKAFLSGDPGSAKRLSEKGHYHDRIMKELHSKAMDLIFQERNMNFESDTLDLHGLHVKEAIQIIEDRLDYDNESSLPLYIIIGVGHHSNFMARLPTKVKEYITNRGLRYKDCSTDKREGLIMVFK